MCHSPRINLCMFKKISFRSFTPIFISMKSINLCGLYEGQEHYLSRIVFIPFKKTIYSLGINSGKRVQTTLTLIKIGSLLLLLLFGFLAFKHEIWMLNWSHSDIWNLRKLNLDGNIKDYTTVGALGALSAAL